MAPLAQEQSCQYLATSKWPALTALEISFNSLEATALAELVQADWPMLRTLQLMDNQYSGSALVAQIAKSTWTGVQHLNLSGTRLGVDDAKQLGHLTRLQLKRLVLYGCFYRCFRHLDEDSRISAMHHVSAGEWPELQALDVGFNNLSADSTAELVKGQWPALQDLDISCSRWGSQSRGKLVQALATAPWMALQRLNLASSRLTAQDISSLGNLNWTHITQLKLTHCLHPDSDSDSDVDGDSDSGTKDQSALADAMRAFTAGKWPRLTALDVSSNNMDDTVMHQLTHYLSPSTVLAYIDLNGNNVASLFGLDNLEHAPMSNWKHLRELNLIASKLSPEEIELLLWSAPQSLHKLQISCQVKQATTARPSCEHWPCLTTLRMYVTTGPNLCEVLCSLSAGFWPVYYLDLIVETGQHHEFSVEEVAELVKWDLSMLRELQLENLGIGDPHQMPEMARVLSLGHWPNLRTLGLSSNIIDDLFVSILIGGKWPSLSMVALCENKIGEDGVRLLHASWPGTEVQL